MAAEFTEKFLNSLLNSTEDKYYTDRSGLVVRAHPRKNGDGATVNFYLRSRRGGQDYRVKLGEWPRHTVAAVRREYYRVLDCIEKGQDWRTPAAPDGAITFGAAWQEWRQYKDQGLAENTLKKYEALYKNQVAPYAAMDLKAVDARWVRANIIDPMVNRGCLCYAEYTATILKKFLDYCCVMGYVPANSLAGIKQILPRRTKKHFKTFLDETLEQDMVKLFAAFKQDTPQLQFMMQMYFYTLLRNVELRLLRWDQVDPSFEFCTVKTKCHPVFKVPFCTQAQELLKAFYRRKMPFENYVFHNANGDPYCEATINRSLHRKGIEFTTHGVRSCGRQWLQKEPGIKETIAELCLAHVAGNQTMQAYNRGDYFNERTEAMQKWGDFVTHCIKEAGAFLLDTEKTKN